MIHDGYEKNGTPIYVTRRVVDKYPMKNGRDVDWGVYLDTPISNNIIAIPYKMVKGCCAGNDVSVLGVYCDMGRLAGMIDSKECDMIISDAKARLKMRYDTECRIRENGGASNYSTARGKRVERFFSELQNNIRNYEIICKAPDKKR